MTERIVCLKCGREGHHSSSCKRRMEGDHGSAFSHSLDDGILNAYLAVLLHPEGVTSVEVASLIDLGLYSTKTKLSFLRQKELVDIGYMHGNTWLWMLPDAAKAFSAEQWERARVSELGGRTKRRKAAVARVELKAELDSLVDDDPVVQRLVSAHDAAPLAHVAPQVWDARRWVFDVAGFTQQTSLA